MKIANILLKTAGARSVIGMEVLPATAVVSKRNKTNC
jgi:hypothetical protein